MGKNTALQKAGKIALCAAMGVLLFWLLESGLERRAGLDLFLPLADGQFLPGRAVRLAAALAFCLAVGLSAQGRRLRQAINERCKKDWARWAVSAVVTGLFVLWTARVTVFSFMTNDDTTIMKAIARIPENGLAAASDSFSNIFFCGLIGLFYCINPDGCWYAGYHIFAISASLVIIGRCILVKTIRRGWPVPAGCLIHLILCAGFFAYTLATLSFTMTPAVVGTAAIALMLCRSDTASAAGRVLSDGLSVVLMLLCVLQRRATGNCLLCFWGVAVVYQGLRIFLRRDPTRKRQLLRLGALALAAITLAVASKYIAKIGGYTDHEYQQAEYYRSTVMDYLLEDLTDEQLEAAGLPPELSTLLRNWYFMDERINVDTFKTISAMYYYTTVDGASSQSLPSRVFSGVGKLISSIQADETMLPLTLCVVCLLLLAAAAFVRQGRRYWPEFLCALCAAGGAGLLCLYLILYGRFPLRVFLVVVIPTAVTILLMALSVPEGNAPPKRRSPALAGASGAVGLVLCVCCGISLCTVPYITEYADRQTLFASQWAIEDYANEHPDTFFVTSFLEENLDPFHSGTYPANMDQWGDTGVTARASRLYAADFFREDLQFMCQRPSYVLFLLQYLSLDYGPVQALVTDQIIGAISAYDVSQVTPGEDYTGWYEQNGMTYYFENGQAVTGTQVIDGVEYEFAPAGADSQFCTVSTDGGLIYTTDAYSLVSSSG